MKLDVSRSTCVGAGQCVLVAEEIFDQDDDGLVVVLDAAPEPRLEGAARQAAALCPAQAIHVHD